MTSEKLVDLSNDLDIDIQELASYLDCTAFDLICFNENEFDSLERDIFNSTFNLLKNESDISTAFDDDTQIVAVRDFYVIIHENFENRFIIFEKQNIHKVEKLINSYR